MPRLSINLPESTYQIVRGIAASRNCSFSKAATELLEKSAQLDEDAFLIQLAQENCEKYGTDFLPVERLWDKKRLTKLDS